MRVHQSTAVAGAMLLLAAVTSHAQDTVRDEFEAPQLQVADGGAWSYRFDVGHQRQSLASAQGHRGPLTQALRLESDGGDPVGLLAGLGRGVRAGTGSQYVRFWFREERVAPSPGGGASVAMVHVDSTVRTATEVLWNWGNHTLYSQCFDGADNLSVGTVAVATDGGWHLIELAARGVGAPSGECVWWFDGRAVESIPRAWPANRFEALLLGLPYGDGTFVGSLLFDDYAASDRPLSARVRWSTAQGAQAGRCVPVTLEVLDSVDAGLCATTAPLTVALSASAGASFFRESTCQTPVSQLSPPVGTSAITFGLRAPTAGAIMLRALPDDLLGDTTTVDILPAPDAGAASDAGAADAGRTDAGAPLDAGSDPDAGSQPDGGARPDAGEPLDAGARPDAGPASPAGPYAVGCGCGASGAPTLLTLGLLLLCARRSRLQPLEASRATARSSATASSARAVGTNT